MFENKQKEQTSTSGNSNSAGTAKVVPVKGEHRRVPSVASMDKLVRRWSSVSDMSIDLSQNDNGGFNDKSENGTPAGTPTSANQEANSSKARADKDASGAKHPVTSQSWSSQKDGDTPKDPITTNSCSSTFNTASPSSLSAVVTESPKKQTKSCSADDMAITSSTESEASFDKELGVSKRQGNTRISEHVASNVSTRTQLETSLRTAEEALPKHYDTLTTPSPEEHAQMTDKEITSVAHEVPVTSEQVGQKGNRGSRLRSKEMHAEAVASGRNDRSSRTVGKVSSGVDPKSKATSNPRTNFRGSSGRDGAPSAETEGHDASLRRKSLPRKVEDARRKVAVGSEMLSPPDYSGRQGTNLSRQSSNAEQELNLLGGKVKSVNDGNAVPLEQTRVTRPAKGNQDELQMKANELEKLFAAHKLTTTRRGKSTDAQVDDTPRVSEPRPTKVLPEKIYTKQTVMDSMTNNFDATELLKMVDNEGYKNNSTPDKHDMLSLEESRGKFYDQYSQKRDAKLKEDWKLQKEEKEAMLKAMHESLERSKAEMRAKFSQSSDLLDSTYVSRSAQKISPLQSVIRNKDQGVDSFLVEDEMNSDYLSGDGSSRSADSRKHFSNRVAYTPKISIAPVHNHKHSSRTVRPSYPNRRNPLENSLAQSVPNLSDLRKENTKPGHSRVTARAQPKSFSRSKSIIEESKSIMNEDQSRGSQSMRKNLNASDLRDTSSVNKDIYNWAPSRTTSSTHKSGAPKSFPRKANGAHPIVGITGFRAPMFANVNDDDDDFPDQQEDSPDDAKNEGYESIEENLRESDFPADSESETPKLSHDFGNSDDPGSENGDVSFPGEAASTKFNSFAGNMHDLPGELPAPWSSRLPHLLPYANDTSDGDAFVDSLTGSPSPWNSHSLDQITDADVSRMRKKWGSAQMPFSGANASQQPRKDVTKGFKKLLKFGRKNRGADGLVNDWVSASTASECDDDLEDVRDLAMGSSDDFRKSRMGYPSSYDGFVENEVFTEQEPSLRSSIPNPPANFRLREDLLTGSSSIKAPRSFFSLPTFRSKGGDARLR
uniref:Uncharacterized protein n=1 Tax=Avena sativa TaxID=4498 RepID=A0ACD5WNV5_AVESA